MSTTLEELKAHPESVWLKAMLNGGFGVGKTYTSMTFPKWAYAMLEPNGIRTAMTHPLLLQNMVYYESFILSNDEDVKVTFERLSKYLLQVKADAKAGRVQTLILDNITYLLENRWIYINKYEKQFTKSGEDDVRSMYGTLGRWIYRFILMDVLTMPCHVVVTCHEVEEEEEDPKGKMFKTGRVISNTLGSFRDKAAGLFNAYLFLECKPSGTDYRYSAICRQIGGKNAKNNLGLPGRIEDISYLKITECLNGQVGQSARPQ